MRIITLLLLFLPSWLFSQSSAYSAYKLNFAIPDLPAFKALGTEPSNILRPSNTEDFTFVSSELINSSGLLIPKDLAIEFCPSLLMNFNSSTLANYRKNTPWKTSRFSIGTTNRSDISERARSVALGYRVSLINKGDIRTDKTVTESLSMALLEILDIKIKLVDTIMVIGSIGHKDTLYEEKRQDYMNKDISELIEILAKNNSSFQEVWDSYGLDKYLVERDKLNKLKSDFKEDNWNAEKLDFAFALTGDSPDSLVSNIGYNSFSLWGTYARPIFKNGQLLLGLNYRNIILGSVRTNLISISSRCYFGSNRLKVMAEGQYEYDSFEGFNRVLANSGAEYNIKNGVWLDLTVGLQWNLTDNSSDLVTRFRFRYSLPDNVNKRNDCCPNPAF